MAEKTTQTIDYNKSDGKPVVEFSPEFLSSFDKSILSYDNTLDQLQSLINGKGFDEYGICNCQYNMWYITPSDISEYISNLFKAISMKLIQCDIADLEKFSVEMAKRFIEKNCGKNVPLDNIFALGTYADPRTETLMDLLVQTENTFFDRSVYSKYEMEQRAKDVKEDYNKINSMHFGAAMKAVVKSLPDVIKKAMKESTIDGFVCCSCDTVMTYIETFILFACSLNTCMLTQLIGYCEPMSTYLRKEKATVTQESVSIRGNKPVYVVLISGDNIVSKIIKKFTHSKWSHAAISFDPSLEEMYSYTFATTEYAKSSQGLRREDIRLLNKLDVEVCVYGFYAPNKTVNDMKETIHERIVSGKTRYDLGLLFKKAFNDNAEQNLDNNKKICSAFVNSIIAEFVGKISDKVSPSPDDMAKALEGMDSHEFVKLYEGPCSTYDEAIIKSKVKKFAKDAETKTFSEYVSEFCLVKTNDMNIRARIPFDFNMRNVVLQDCTPNFKDTKSALHYMMKDSRSPIHAMLIESATDRRIASVGECMPVMQMLEPYFREHGHDVPLGFEYDRAGFITDVNWLDKIAYGNNFLDGNYRMDAMGNENRHPIYLTLKMLHKIYCGCGLKTNEDLSNNILKIAGTMIAIINRQPWSCCNKELVKDILCVLGECFTRNVIKLYNNHCNIVTYSDDMDDTMAPGYTYCEAFVYMEADAKDPQPKIEAVNGQNTVQKTGVLNKLTTLIRQFAQWIQNKLGNVPALFEKINGAKIAFVQSHDKLNQEIGNAIANNTFTVTVKNFPVYKIPVDKINNKANNIKNILNEFVQNPNKDFDPVEIKAQIYPGDDATAKEFANIKDPKEAGAAIQRYVLYGQLPNQQTGFVDGKNLNQNLWNDMCNNIKESKRLIDTVMKPMIASLNDGLKAIENVQKQEEKANNANKDQQQQQGDNQQQQPTNKAELMFNTFKDIVQVYQLNMVNAFTNKFFNTSYQLYKEIVDKYQSQNKVQSNQQDKAAAADMQKQTTETTPKTE